MCIVFIARSRWMSGLSPRLWAQPWCVVPSPRASLAVRSEELGPYMKVEAFTRPHCIAATTIWFISK